jgi:hypothetical protein
MSAVKKDIQSMLELLKSNFQRELDEQPIHTVSLNRLFLGPPGTGKTLVAKLYGQLLTEVGCLSKGEVIVANPSDLIGEYIGVSEKNTKAALSAAIGNVLVIDEAHMLYTSNSDCTGNDSDCYRKAVLDTLVAEVQGNADQCVLLLGYGDAMQEMLQNSNPGLARRFPLADAFWFHDFSVPELESILRSKLTDHGLEATEPAIQVAMDMLEKAKTRVNFGNSGDVENLISRTKKNYQKRMSALTLTSRPHQWVFGPEDFDTEYDRKIGSHQSSEAI